MCGRSGNCLLVLQSRPVTGLNCVNPQPIKVADSYARRIKRTKKKFAYGACPTGSSFASGSEIGRKAFTDKHMDVVEDGLSNDVNLQVVVARHCFMPEVNTAATKPSRG